jgi:hypothetical protein
MFSTVALGCLRHKHHGQHAKYQGLDQPDEELEKQDG